MRHPAMRRLIDQLLQHPEQQLRPQAVKRLSQSEMTHHLQNRK
jgi:hypothetical protein